MWSVYVFCLSCFRPRKIKPAERQYTKSEGDGRPTGRLEGAKYKQKMKATSGFSFCLDGGAAACCEKNEHQVKQKKITPKIQKNQNENTKKQQQQVGCRRATTASQNTTADHPNLKKGESKSTRIRQTPMFPGPRQF